MPQLLVALWHRLRPRSGQPRRHLLSPHSQVLFPLSRTGRGLHDPGLTSHLRAGLPGSCGAGRGRPKVPQVNGASEDHQRGPPAWASLRATESFRDGRDTCARMYGAGALRTLARALLFWAQLLDTRLQVSLHFTSRRGWCLALSCSNGVVLRSGSFS